MVYLIPVRVLAFSLTSTIKNPLTQGGGPMTTPGGLYARFAVLMTTLSGVICLVMIIYGGFLILSSRGQDEQIEKGKQILIWCAIGMITIASAYVIANFYLTAANSDMLIRSR